MFIPTSEQRPLIYARAAGFADQRTRPPLIAAIVNAIKDLASKLSETAHLVIDTLSCIALEGATQTKTAKVRILPSWEEL